MFKNLLACIALLSSVGLFANFDPQKAMDALYDAHLHKTDDTFYYEYREDPSTKAVLEEQTHLDGLKTIGPYHLLLRGIKPGRNFQLYGFNVYGIEHAYFFRKGFVDKNGVAWTKKGKDFMELEDRSDYFDGMLPGEPSHSLIIFDDEQQTHLVAKVVPNPLEITDDKGRRVSMEILLAEEPTYLVIGENFSPNESVTMNVQEREFATKKTLITDEHGFFLATLEGKSSQTGKDRGTMEIVSPEMKEPLALTYTWKFLEAPGRDQIRHCTKTIKAKNDGGNGFCIDMFSKVVDFVKNFWLTVLGVF